MKTERGEVVVLDDAEAVTRAGAERFIDAAGRSIAARGRFTVALSGGSTPKAMYRLLAGADAPRVDWPKVEVFFGDERCVPPDHPDSNYRMAKEALLDRVPLLAEHIHRVPAERPPEEAARAYDETLARVLGPEPRLDLILLGMGPDGHTASLFPGTAALAERRARVVANRVEKLGTFRITLTAPVLCAGEEIVVLAAGTEKADALARALEGPAGSVPIQLVRPKSGRMTWLVDRAAAARLHL